MEADFRYDFSGKWFKGNLHMHTSLSDGGLSVEEATAFYADRGYDFLAITDHRSPFINSDWAGKLPLLILEGTELDGKDEQGSFYHVVCIGGLEGVSADMEFGDALQKAKSQGSFLIWAHPHWSGNTASDGLRHGFNAMEVYNHSVEMPIGKGNGAFHWDSVLSEKTDMLGVATDDNHFFVGYPDQVGGWVMVNAPELSEGALMEALRRGNFYSTSGPEFKNIHIEQGNRVVAETSPVLHARLIGPPTKGKWKADIEKRKMTKVNFRIPEEWAFARLEIEDEFGQKAWSNPLIKPS